MDTKLSYIWSVLQLIHRNSRQFLLCRWATNANGIVEFSEIRSIALIVVEALDGAIGFVEVLQTANRRQTLVKLRKEWFFGTFDLCDGRRPYYSAQLRLLHAIFRLEWYLQRFTRFVNVEWYINCWNGFDLLFVVCVLKMMEEWNPTVLVHVTAAKFHIANDQFVIDALGMAVVIGRSGLCQHHVEINARLCKDIKIVLKDFCNTQCSHSFYTLPDRLSS